MSGFVSWVQQLGGLGSDTKLKEFNALCHNTSVVVANSAYGLS